MQLSSQDICIKTNVKYTLQHEWQTLGDTEVSDARAGVVGAGILEVLRSVLSIASEWEGSTSQGRSPF